jgi:hypothetical protein
LPDAPAERAGFLGKVVVIEEDSILDSLLSCCIKVVGVAEAIVKNN